MKFAVIAAGEGSRLNQEGVALPKPLVRLNGESMIDRLLRIFAENDAEEVDVVVNDLHPEVAQHLAVLKSKGGVSACVSWCAPRRVPCTVFMPFRRILRMLLFA